MKTWEQIRSMPIVAIGWCRGHYCINPVTVHVDEKGEEHELSHSMACINTAKPKLILKWCRKYYSPDAPWRGDLSYKEK